jgi:pimeloyl-ACP methyl ester carboxylesterase
MASNQPTVEGQLSWDAPNAGKPCTTWYQVTGGPLKGRVPLVMLHGGPGGVGSPSLSPFLDLPALYGIPVVLYDQLGCGRSTHLPEKEGDTTFWNFELFYAELDALISHLGLAEGGTLSAASSESSSCPAYSFIASNLKLG